MKNIIVCMKQVLDPEIPLSLFQIDPEAKQAIPPKASPPVLSPFDENALEAALKIKDRLEARVTVISLGKKINRVVVSAALAAGADNLVLLQDPAFSEFETYLTVKSIFAAINKLGQFDLILCGLQAADTNAGQVGPGLAAMLGIPCVTAASKVEMVDNGVRVQKAGANGYEVIESLMPVVVTTNYEVGALRRPGVKAFMNAAQKPIVTWNLTDLGIENAETHRFEFQKMYVPAHESKCEMLEGASPEEKAAKLAAKLKEIKVI